MKEKVLELVSSILSRNATGGMPGAVVLVKCPRLPWILGDALDKSMVNCPALCVLSMGVMFGGPIGSFGRLSTVALTERVAFQC